MGTYWRPAKRLPSLEWQDQRKASKSAESKKVSKSIVPSPGHLLPEMQVEPPTEQLAPKPQIRVNPDAENRPWSGFELLIMGMVLLAALFFFSGVFFVLAFRQSQSSGKSAIELRVAHGPLLSEPARRVPHDVFWGGNSPFRRGDAFPRFPLSRIGSMARDPFYDAAANSAGLCMASHHGGMGLSRTPSSNRMVSTAC